MAADLGARKLHGHGAAARATALIDGQLVPGAHVRKEAADPDRGAPLPGDVFGVGGLERRLGVQRLQVELAHGLACFATVGRDERLRVGAGRQQQREVVVVEQPRRT